MSAEFFSQPSVPIFWGPSFGMWLVFKAPEQVLIGVSFVEISAVWLNSPHQSDDPEYSGTYFVIMNSLEIFFYSFGASATVFSRYAISIASSTSTSLGSMSQKKKRHYGRPGWFRDLKQSISGHRSSQQASPGSKSQASSFNDRPALVGMDSLLRHAQKSNPNSFTEHSVV